MRVYLACSADGFVPCLVDDAAGEQLAWLGGVNVAGTRATSPRRPRTLEEIRAMAPQVIDERPRGTASRGCCVAGAGRGEGGAGLRMAVAALRLGARPPSVNRLLLAWLAYVVRGRVFDPSFEADIRSFFRDFYHLELTDTQLRKLLAPA